MFIDGQKVRCINPGHAGDFKHGQLYTIYRVVGDINMYVIDGKGKSVLKNCSRFESIKAKLPPVKNDIEWLDRVQQNFKE